MGLANRYEKMRHITYCPACETQFFVTDEQLNQHEGKVRCGQCSHVFNAKQLILETSTGTDSVPHYQIQEPEPSPDPVISDDTPVLPSEPTLNVAEEVETSYQPNYFDEFLDKTKLGKRRKPVNKWVWFVLAAVLLVFASLQCLYYLRNELALYYPATKPHLEQLCQYAGCRIELPKKIDLMMIDDSDIQEDANHTGLIWLSSTLINQAAFNMAYPNLELTLTDVEDKPKLRRIISPTEYLPTGTDISKGLPASTELRIRLPIKTDNEVLAGYRVLLTY